MAKSTIGSLLIDLQLSTSTLDKQLKGMDKKFNGMTKSIKMIGGALAGAFAVTSFSSMIDNTLQLNDALGKTADRLGIAVEELQGLHFAAEQSGVSIPTLEMALQRMTRRVSEAGQGTGEAVKALKELGIEASALSQMTVSDQLDVLADSLSGVESESDKVRIAMKLFDSEGVKLLNMLKDGAAGLDAYKEEANSLGFVLDRQMIAKMEAANDSMNKVDRASQGLQNVLAVALAPAITTVANSFIDWVTQGEGAQGMLKNLHAGIRSVLKALDVLSESLALSLQGWIMIGGSVDLVAETFFGTAEGVKRAEDALISMSNVADNQFAKTLEAFDEGGSLAKSFDINLADLEVTAQRTGTTLEKLGGTTGKAIKKLKESKKEVVEISEEYKQLESVFTGAFASMEDSIVTFAQTGKFAFNDFAESILEDLLRMIIQLQITIPLMNSLKSAMGGGSMSLFAQGGVVGSSNVQAFASGGIVNSPTIFPMANGMGLMGEKGSEAIMPLTRTSGGDLGVKAVGGGGGTIVNVYNQSDSEAKVEESTGGDGQKTIDIMILSSVERGIGSGQLDSSFRSNFGIARKGY